jgi:hypothetical protein
VRTRIALCFASIALGGCQVIAGIDDRVVDESDSTVSSDTGDSSTPIDASDTKDAAQETADAAAIDSRDANDTNDASETPPPDCVAGKDPKDDGCTATDATGVFVAPTGNDLNDGTALHPLHTIMKGMTLARTKSKARVYVCEGSYVETLSIDVTNESAEIAGGFSCADWRYTGKRPAVTTILPSVVLTGIGLTVTLRIYDLELDALDGTVSTPPSVVAFFSNAASVELHRVKLVAGRGGTPNAPATPTSNHFAGTLTGSSAASCAALGSSATTCACPFYGSSTGGKGGDYDGPSFTPYPGSAGSASPTVVGSPPTDGAGGPAGSCAGTPAHNGAPGLARAGGAAATTYGALTASGWTSSDGGSGDSGDPAQGGGGGGADTTGYGGAGGGCGGCGGAGGLAGVGGGGSIALLSFHTPMSLTGCTLAANNGGLGGTGGDAEGGQGGGGPGAPCKCGAGSGGAGAGGSGGGGGTGGISAGIVWSGTSVPSFDGTPYTNAAAVTGIVVGAAGDGGAAGALGAAASGGNPGSVGTKGKPGTVMAVMNVP